MCEKKITLPSHRNQDRKTVKAENWKNKQIINKLSVVAGSISSGGDHGIHCWWDLIRSKQLSSVPVYRACVFGRFSGHGNSIHNINSST